MIITVTMQYNTEKVKYKVFTQIQLSSVLNIKK